MEIATRAAQVADMAALVELVREVQELHVANRPDVFKPIRDDEVVAWFNTLFASPAVRIFVAEVRGLICGYLGLVLRDHPEGPFSYARSFAEIDQIGVRRSFRRRGVARALVTAANDYAIALGRRSVELSSWNFNESDHAAFKQLGFRGKVVRFERLIAE